MNTPETEVITNHMLKDLNENFSTFWEKKEIDWDFASLDKCS